MRFSIRLALSIAVLVACTAVMGIAGLLAVNDAQDRFRATDERYEELRGLYEIGHRAAAARLLLNATPPDAPEIRHQLVAALRETDRLLALAGETPGGPRAALSAPLQEIRTNIEAAIVANRDPQASARDAQTLNSSLGQVAACATAANRDILANRAETARRVERARWTLGVVLGATLLVAVLLGTAQHQSIARPLRALRRGVERISAGQLGERIPQRGPRDFRNLIDQFNQMAGTIQALESSLSRQVEIKSRQLILSERLAGLGYLAAGLAHEINTPLAVIGGHAETMLRRLGTAPLAPGTAGDVAGALRTITEEVFRCRDITAGLLQMTRHGDEPPPPEAIDLSALVERAVEMIRRLPSCARRRLEITEAFEGPLLARGSRAQLMQVLLNLLTNALDATEPGGGHVSVSIASQAGSALIRISDNGRGMTPEVLSRVFDPLFSGMPPGGRGGFGLGLSISHAIIERHGGRIDARSDGPGRGSTFLVELPALSAVTSCAP